MLPKEKVILKSIFNQMISSQDMSYEFIFLDHYPCFIYSGNVVQSKKVSGKFILNTKSKITRLISPFMDESAKKSTNFNVSYNDNYTEATITFEKKMEIESEKKEEKKLFILPNRPKRVNIPSNVRNVGNTLINNALNNNAIKSKYPGLRNGYTPLNYFSFLFHVILSMRP